MKNIIKILGISVLAVMMVVTCFSVTAMAQAPTARRFKLNGSMDMDWKTLDPDKGDSTDITEYNVLVGVGYFITDMFEVGPEIGYLSTEKETSGSKDENTMWSLGVKANAHFNLDMQMVPYVGVNLGFGSIDNGDTDDSSFLYGVQAGVDYFITESVSVNPELRYTMGSFKLGSPGNEMDYDYSDLSLMIGIAAHF